MERPYSQTDTRTQRPARATHPHGSPPSPATLRRREAYPPFPSGLAQRGELVMLHQVPNDTHSCHPSFSLSFAGPLYEVDAPPQSGRRLPSFKFFLVGREWD